METNEYTYDLFVIGGGSGGLACAKEAAELGKKVGLADYVKPTIHGTKWSLGGTCVNVGCIPKKLMHFSAVCGEITKDQKECGWNIPELEHNWETMVKNVNRHIRVLNWGYKVQLRSKQVKYYNGKATMIDAHTLEISNINGVEGKNETVTAAKIVVAVGGRPTYPDIPGAELGITSDDLFWKQNAPGKTLVVGASYVALECAGFLQALGYDTTLMVRSIFLRGFDQDMANRVGTYMENHKLKIIKQHIPLKVEKTMDEKLKVTFGPTSDPNSEVKEETFDTVLFAIGRYAVTKDVGLEKIGIKLSETNYKIQVNDEEQTVVPHIYAIGDCIQGKLELTPVAIKAGRLLSRRLFGGKTEKMNYENIPTTVFTPLEYGSCGLSEEKCEEKYGKENLDVWHTHFKPLEWNMFQEHEDDACYVKVICTKADQKVVGFHITGPNAADITQGIAIAMNCGLTKEKLDATVGIHPTIAEEVCGLNETKAMNPLAKKTGC